jgi:hypothetical protein
MIRVGVYLAALMVVIVLLRQRRTLIPTYNLKVIEVLETDQLDSLFAREGEKLVVVRVWLTVHAQIKGRLEPDFFSLQDAQGREYRPDFLSPMFSGDLPGDHGRGVEGTLVFHLPRGMVGKSLSFHAQVENDAPDLRSTDFGPENGP